MRILVYPHDMEIGGSQINAIELARAISDLGHDVAVFGGPGPLRQLVSGFDLELIETPAPGRRPSPGIMGTLTRLVEEREIDLVHAYEWPPTLEAAYGPHMRRRTPVVSTVMSMGVAPFIPWDIPLVVGTAAIQDACLTAGHPKVHLLEPPVDTGTNASGVLPVAVAEWSKRYRLAPDDFVVTVVSRLALELKREGILEAIDAVSSMGEEVSIRLVIVGDGPARAEVEERAQKANASAGREIVTVTGEIQDPRPAYDRADVVIGMGSSALRGMAFGKPLVVQGERGFWELATHDSLPLFLKQGWYGIGPGHGGTERLRQILAGLIVDPDRRTSLGEFSRHVATSRFSLERAAEIQDAIYQRAMPAGGLPVRATAFARSCWGLSWYKVARRVQRLRGVAPVDDFNATANIVQSPPTSEPAR